MLPSSFEQDGSASRRQHTTCFVIDDKVAIDAGSLANAATGLHRSGLRDIILTHAHLDHIAGLPLFIDDLFASLTEPIRVHASEEVIEVLERDIFNWSVYPRFSELTNEHGPVLSYFPLGPSEDVAVAHLLVRAIDVNHKVPSSGFVISDGKVTIALTGDTAAMDGFWDTVNDLEKLDALLIECAFPDELKELARISHHLTPSLLAYEISKFQIPDCPIYVVNLKPMYRDRIVEEITELGIDRLEVFEVGKDYVL